MKNNTTIFSSRFLALIFFLFSFSTISAQTVDTDGDGIVDQLDLDDDNDGIPDSAECSVTPVNMVAWTNNTDAFPPTVTTAYNSFITAANSGAGGGIVRTRNTANNFQQISQIDATSEAQAVTNNEYVSYSITTGARYIAINQIGYFAQSASVNNIAYTFTLRMSSDNFATNTQVHSPVIYSASGADITVNTLQTLYLSPNTTYQFRVYFYNVSGGAASVIGHDDFKLRGGFECDTDGDNLPNRLDLDSDGDGCFDAIEGDENVLLNQLNSNGSINITSNGGIGTTVGTNNGVPNLVNSGGAADIGADVGQGVGDSQNNSTNNQCVDSDGDGIQNEFDMDDDNDGILDRDEDCAYLAQNNSGPWIGQTTSNVTVSRTGTLTSFSDTFNGPQNRYQVNQGGAGQWVFLGGNVSYQMTFSQPIPANEVAIFIYDLTPNLSTGFSNFTVSINGAAPSNILSSIVVAGVSQPVTGFLNYNATTGVATLNPSGGNSQSIMLKGTGTTMVSSILITSAGVSTSDGVQYSIFGKKICDADGDTVPNYLDLDSDGDGCFDAIEGDENVLSTQLNTNGSINTGSNGGIGTTSGTNNGVPNLVNSGGAADIGGDVGQGIGASQNLLINTCLDADNDGIPDICDLDDDNDGILDINESSCALVGQTIRIGYIPNSRDLDTDNGYTFDGQYMNGSGALKLTNTANFGPSGIVKANIVLVNMGTAPITKAIINSLNLNVIFLGGIDNGTAPPVSYLSSAEYDAIKDWSDDALTNLVVATQSNTLAWGSSITSGNTNPDVPTTYGSQTTLFNGPFGNVTSFDQGGSYQAYFASINSLCGGASPLAVDASNRAVMYIDGTYGDLLLADVDILTTYGGVTAGNAITSNNDRLFANIWAFVAQQSLCIDKDLDGDGIPNRLDLDTDNDGCLDALEGDENISISQLVNAANGLSVGTGSTAANQNLCATSSCVDASGVPNIVNSGGAGDIGGDVGQGIGDSQNSLINGCVCYENPGLVTGQTYPVKHGITALSRAGADSGNWPMLRNSAYTALESKTKGFVITRNSSPETTIAIPVVGMVVFDTDENAGKGCLKIYTGSAVGEGWKCYTTPGCP